jgi:hypothetical protein
MGAFTPQTVVASAARTTTGQSSAVTPGGVAPSGPSDTVALAVDVTAASGTTPSMTVSVEWSFDGTAFFVSDVADAFVAITTTKKTVKLFDVKAPMYRVVWTITGTTPSFTFSVTELADSD